MSKCTFKPEMYKETPIGMFHCPECGEIVVAGFPHPDYDKIYKELEKLKYREKKHE